MSDLAGPFHFKGAMEDTLAEQTAEQMNCLNGNGLHPDVTWQAVRGRGILCARVDDRNDAEIVGNALANIGVIDGCDILEITATESENAYFIIAVDLTEIDREILDEELTNPRMIHGSEDEFDEIFNRAPHPFRGPVFN